MMQVVVFVTILAASVNTVSSGDKEVLRTVANQTPLLTEEVLYAGWRASTLLGRQVTSSEGELLGTIRNLSLGQDGKIEFLLIEAHARDGEPDYVFRIPFETVDKGRLPFVVSANIKPERMRESLFAGETGTPSRFPVSAVIGDHARLRAGHGYGYVSDVVFNREGEMLAILVTRDRLSGGGLYAFAFPGHTGRWNPRDSYYGLPFVTPDQATAAGVRVDRSRFGGS